LLKIHDVISKLNLRQSAFCIEIFDADIHLPATSLQALSPISLPRAPSPERDYLQVTKTSISSGRELTARLQAVRERHETSEEKLATTRVKAKGQGLLRSGTVGTLFG